MIVDQDAITRAVDSIVDAMSFTPIGQLDDNYKSALLMLGGMSVLLRDDLSLGTHINRQHSRITREYKSRSHVGRVRREP